MCAGEVTGIVDARHTSKEEIGRLMSGAEIQKTEGGNA
jgi:hypothetical protein